MLQKLKSIITQNIHNFQGWNTKRKIVVIESDDWGTIRMPSKETYNTLLKSGMRVDKCVYNRYDSLASEEDLSALFEVLMHFKDINGKSPVITANTIVANPDFNKIKASGFKEYHYELFPETLKRYPDHSNSFLLWKQGLQEDIFVPQFHGREHVNIHRWMSALQSNLPETRLAFELELFGISTHITTEKRRSYMAALDFDSLSELESQKMILTDGLNQFEKIFGYYSSSFIATNHVWNSAIETELFQAGIRFIQGSSSQYQPLGNNKPYKKIRHRLGEKNDSGQIYLTRNCSFEPSMHKNKHIIKDCINDMASAFRWNTPAIISAHRLNFIGSIVEENRIENLKLFAELIRIAQDKWPQIEFMSSEQLGNLIVNR
ncbi:MAG: hypothetical protein Q7U54_03650 [Bacteroidales bacterium]|nr:hypothetical protein [Bacteroidales bacterium]